MIVSGGARVSDSAGRRGARIDRTGGPLASIALVHLAHARSGDKGDTVNIGLIAYDPADYGILVEQVTAERVAAHFGSGIGPVERFQLPGIHALNFLLHDALDGGGTVSLMNDAQGKVFSTALLRMEIEVPPDVAERARGRGRVPEGWRQANPAEDAREGRPEGQEGGME